MAAAGLPEHVKPHDLRHLSNTLAAQVPGVTVRDLMARMGHRSERAALRYLHASDTADSAMAAGLDAALRRSLEADQPPSDETALDGPGPHDTDTAADVG